MAGGDCIARLYYIQFFRLLLYVEKFLQRMYNFSEEGRKQEQDKMEISNDGQFGPSQGDHKRPSTVFRYPGHGGRKGK